MSLVAEVFPNLAVGNLNGGISSSAVSAALQSGHTFPSTGNYMAKIDNEIIQITVVSTNTATIARGQEGTTAVSHSDGALVFGILTSGSLGRLLGQMSNGVLTTQRRNLNFLDGNGVVWTLADDATNNACDISVGNPSIVTPGLLATWTWENQTSAAGADVNGGGLSLIGTAQAGTNAQMLVKSLPSAPYTIIAAIRGLFAASSNQRSGICIYNSTSTKLNLFGIKNSNAWCVTQYSSPTATSSEAFSLTTTFALSAAALWLKIQDDGTNRKYSVSFNGTSWVQLGSEANTTFLTPTHAGIVVDSANASLQSAISLVSWNVTTP